MSEESTTSDLVELTRVAWEGVDRHDRDRVASFYGPDAVLDLAGFEAVADEVCQLDDERVLVLSDFSARGKTSGLEVGQKEAELFHIRDGKVTRLVTDWERERALSDLGLAE
jgi:ketosteroid isomerase-like protein